MKSVRRSRVLSALAVSAAFLLAPIAIPTAAHAAGDVCDLCSINFDLGACEGLGGYPYDSTVEAPPAAVSGGGGGAPKPAPAPAPAPKPAPAPAPAPKPAQPPATGNDRPAAGTSNSTTTNTNTSTTPEKAAVAATVPTAPTGLSHEIDGTTLSLAWTAPADGGSALTGYKLVLNEGTPIALPADATEYEIELGEGTYDLTLIATNAVGDSPASESIAGVEIAGEETETAETPATVTAEAPVEAGIPLAAPLTLGGIVVVAGGLLTWWWLRRRSSATATVPAAASDDGTPIL
ncbi:fibronectin type III domain-containing protein [Microbacterium sp. MYb45]|uniref:fibronectin type III domain-containing protein n=1 Tax=Microbacterium sp. MYb45 TaxID=1827294 RepID=UPI0015E2B866|nr:fibronectin type III domain-containing protein [Microbacterium sp. MYb45]